MCRWQPSICLAAACFLLPALLFARDVWYPGATAGDHQILPAFDKGRLLFLGMGGSCHITVYGPGGEQAFAEELPGPPGSERCSVMSAAADTDGTVAVSVAYMLGPEHAAGIILLDPQGKQTALIPTGRYMPTHICIDQEHMIWSIGWQRGARQEIEEKADYPVVRRFRPDGQQLGAYLPRSLWSRSGNPGGVILGFWTMAAAKDRIGAIVHENYSGQTPELVEWDLHGQLLSRTPIPKRPESGRAYSAGGRLFAASWNSETKQHELNVLEPGSGAWTRVADPSTKVDFLLGADGEELVYSEQAPGVLHLRWVTAPAVGGSALP